MPSAAELTQWKQQAGALIAEFSTTAGPGSDTPAQLASGVVAMLTAARQWRDTHEPGEVPGPGANLSAITVTEPPVAAGPGGAGVAERKVDLGGWLAELAAGRIPVTDALLAQLVPAFGPVWGARILSGIPAGAYRFTPAAAGPLGLPGPPTMITRADVDLDGRVLIDEQEIATIASGTGAGRRAGAGRIAGRVVLAAVGGRAVLLGEHAGQPRQATITLSGDKPLLVRRSALHEQNAELRDALAAVFRTRQLAQQQRAELLTAARAIDLGAASLDRLQEQLDALQQALQRVGETTPLVATDPLTLSPTLLRVHEQTDAVSDAQRELLRELAADLPMQAVAVGVANLGRLHEQTEPILEAIIDQIGDQTGENSEQARRHYRTMLILARATDLRRQQPGTPRRGYTIAWPHHRGAPGQLDRDPRTLIPPRPDRVGLLHPSAVPAVGLDLDPLSRDPLGWIDWWEQRTVADQARLGLRPPARSDDQHWRTVARTAARTLDNQTSSTPAGPTAEGLRQLLDDARARLSRGEPPLDGATTLNRYTNLHGQWQLNPDAFTPRSFPAAEPGEADLRVQVWINDTAVVSSVTVNGEQVVRYHAYEASEDLMADLHQEAEVLARADALLDRGEPPIADAIPLTRYSGYGGSWELDPGGTRGYRFRVGSEQEGLPVQVWLTSTAIVSRIVVDGQPRMHYHHHRADADVLARLAREPAELVAAQAAVAAGASPLPGAARLTRQSEELGFWSLNPDDSYAGTFPTGAGRHRLDVWVNGTAVVSAVTVGNERRVEYHEYTTPGPTLERLYRESTALDHAQTELSAGRPPLADAEHVIRHTDYAGYWTLDEQYDIRSISPRFSTHTRRGGLPVEVWFNDTGLIAKFTVDGQERVQYHERPPARNMRGELITTSDTDMQVSLVQIADDPPAMAAAYAEATTTSLSEWLARHVGPWDQPPTEEKAPPDSTRVAAEPPQPATVPPTTTAQTTGEPAVHPAVDPARDRDYATMLATLTPRARQLLTDTNATLLPGGRGIVFGADTQPELITHAQTHLDNRPATREFTVFGHPSTTPTTTQLAQLITELQPNATTPIVLMICTTAPLTTHLAHTTNRPVIAPPAYGWTTLHRGRTGLAGTPRTTPDGTLRPHLTTQYGWTAAIPRPNGAPRTRKLGPLLPDNLSRATRGPRIPSTIANAIADLRWNTWKHTTGTTELTATRNTQYRHWADDIDTLDRRDTLRLQRPDEPAHLAPAHTALGPRSSFSSLPGTPRRSRRPSATSSGLLRTAERVAARATSRNLPGSTMPGRFAGRQHDTILEFELADPAERRLLPAWINPDNPKLLGHSGIFDLAGLAQVRAGIEAALPDDKMRKEVAGSLETLVNVDAFRGMGHALLGGGATLFIPLKDGHGIEIRVKLNLSNARHLKDPTKVRVDNTMQLWMDKQADGGRSSSRSWTADLDGVFGTVFRRFSQFKGFFGGVGGAVTGSVNLDSGVGSVDHESMNSKSMGLTELFGFDGVYEVDVRRWGAPEVHFDVQAPDGVSVRFSRSATPPDEAAVVPGEKAADLLAPPDWNTYRADHATRPPRQALLHALDQLGPGNGRLAIDIGAGQGTETVEMLKRGWRVLAIESDPAAIALLRSTVGPRLASRLQTVTGDISRVELPPADLIWAGDSLPFVARDRFPATWAKIRSALNPGGALAVDLWGSRHDWRRERLTHTRREVQKLIGGLEVIHVDEHEAQRATVAEGTKNWHTHTILARQPADPTRAAAVPAPAPTAAQADTDEVDEQLLVEKSRKERAAAEAAVLARNLGKVATIPPYKVVDDADGIDQLQDVILDMLPDELKAYGTFSRADALTFFSHEGFRAHGHKVPHGRAWSRQINEDTPFGATTSSGLTANVTVHAEVVNLRFAGATRDVAIENITRSQLHAASSVGSAAALRGKGTFGADLSFGYTGAAEEKLGDYTSGGGVTEGDVTNSVHYDDSLGGASLTARANRYEGDSTLFVGTVRYRVTVDVIRPGAAHGSDLQTVHTHTESAPFDVGNGVLLRFTRADAIEYGVLTPEEADILVPRDLAAEQAGDRLVVPGPRIPPAYLEQGRALGEGFVSDLHGSPHVAEQVIAHIEAQANDRAGVRPTDFLPEDWRSRLREAARDPLPPAAPPPTYIQLVEGKDGSRLEVRRVDDGRLVRAVDFERLPVPLGSPKGSAPAVSVRTNRVVEFEDDGRTARRTIVFGHDGALSVTQHRSGETAQHQPDGTPLAPAAVALMTDPTTRPWVWNPRDHDMKETNLQQLMNKVSSDSLATRAENLIGGTGLTVKLVTPDKLHELTIKLTSTISNPRWNRTRTDLRTRLFTMAQRHGQTAFGVSKSKGWGGSTAFRFGLHIPGLRAVNSSGGGKRHWMRAFIQNTGPTSKVARNATTPEPMAEFDFDAIYHVDSTLLTRHDPNVTRIARVKPTKTQRHSDTATSTMRVYVPQSVTRAGPAPATFTTPLSPTPVTRAQLDALLAADDLRRAELAVTQAEQARDSAQVALDQASTAAAAVASIARARERVLRADPLVQQADQARADAQRVVDRDGGTAGYQFQVPADPNHLGTELARIASVRDQAGTAAALDAAAALEAKKVADAAAQRLERAEEALTHAEQALADARAAAMAERDARRGADTAALRDGTAPADETAPLGSARPAAPVPNIALTSLRAVVDQVRATAVAAQKAATRAHLAMDEAQARRDGLHEIAAALEAIAATSLADTEARRLARLAALDVIARHRAATGYDPPAGANTAQRLADQLPAARQAVTDAETALETARDTSRQARQAAGSSARELATVERTLSDAEQAAGVPSTLPGREQSTDPHRAGTVAEAGRVDERRGQAWARLDEEARGRVQTTRLATQLVAAEAELAEAERAPRTAIIDWAGGIDSGSSSPARSSQTFGPPRRAESVAAADGATVVSAGAARVSRLRSARQAMAPLGARIRATLPQVHGWRGTRINPPQTATSARAQGSGTTPAAAFDPAAPAGADFRLAQLQAVVDRVRAEATAAADAEQQVWAAVEPLRVRVAALRDVEQALARVALTTPGSARRDQARREAQRVIDQHRSTGAYTPPPGADTGLSIRLSAVRQARVDAETALETTLETAREAERTAQRAARELAGAGRALERVQGGSTPRDVVSAGSEQAGRLRAARAGKARETAAIQDTLPLAHTWRLRPPSQRPLAPQAPARRPDMASAAWPAAFEGLRTPSLSGRSSATSSRPATPESARPVPRRIRLRLERLRGEVDQRRREAMATQDAGRTATIRPARRTPRPDDQALNPRPAAPLQTAEQRAAARELAAAEQRLFDAEEAAGVTSTLPGQAHEGSDGASDVHDLRRTVRNLRAQVWEHLVDERRNHEMATHAAGRLVRAETLADADRRRAAAQATLAPEPETLRPDTTSAEAETPAAETESATETQTAPEPEPEPERAPETETEIAAREEVERLEAEVTSTREPASTARNEHEVARMRAEQSGLAGTRSSASTRQCARWSRRWRRPTRSRRLRRRQCRRPTGPPRLRGCPVRRTRTGRIWLPPWSGARPARMPPPRAPTMSRRSPRDRPRPRRNSRQLAARPRGRGQRCARPRMPATAGCGTARRRRQPQPRPTPARYPSLGRPLTAPGRRRPRPPSPRTTHATRFAPRAAGPPWRPRPRRRRRTGPSTTYPAPPPSTSPRERQSSRPSPEPHCAPSRHARPRRGARHRAGSGCPASTE